MTNRQIFPPEDAERFYKDSAGEPYRPSNSTEGECFEAVWCRNCRRDKPADAGGCSISLDAFSYDIGDPSYPAAWRYGEDGQPVCTAFSDKHAPRPAYRCKATVDLFPPPDSEASR